MNLAVIEGKTLTYSFYVNRTLIVKVGSSAALSPQELEYYRQDPKRLLVELQGS